MSRYIDADNVIERLGAYLMTDAQIEYGGLASEDIEDWKPIAIDILKGAPSIDIDIVRCGECEYIRINEDGETRYFYCALEDRPNRQWSVDDTDFCSWGERKTDADG